MKKRKTLAAETNITATVAKAKDGLASVGRILTGGYATDVTFTWDVSESDGQVRACYTLESASGKIHQLYRDVMDCNLAECGFVNRTINKCSDLTRRVVTHADFVYKPQTSVCYGEITISQLVQFVKAHREAFPNGMHTKVCLGDFEGNTFHTKIVPSADVGRLFLGYELNEP